MSKKSSATGALLLMIRFACTWKICCRAVAVSPGVAWEDAQDAIDDLILLTVALALDPNIW